ncbi:ankyrin repeat domain-containing protein [Legionella lytica]|uniref:Ankyrin repeat domain-containing protein n=1 Tax=Legionella lytica TaxID=96232 RepID=A0ABW8D7L6_9GAMM
MAKLHFLYHLAEQLTSEHKKALSRFIESPHNNGSNLEKLHRSTNAKLYSIRVNAAERLILCRSKGGEWVLCNILSDHDYKHLLQQPDCWFSEEDLEEWSDSYAQKEEVLSQENDVLELEPASQVQWHKNDFIVLDEEQQEAKRLTLPLIISGAPGSGKSCVAVSIFLQRIKQCLVPEEEHPQRLLYVAESPVLVEEMKREWAKTASIEKLNKCHQMVFKTFKELHAEAAPGTHCETKSDFFKWLKKVYGKNKEALVQDIMKNPERVYLECRIISGYDTVEDYVNQVGLRHSFYKKKKEQCLVWDVYQHYLKYLGAKIHPAFHSLEKAPGKYDLILVDETPDASRKELRSLKKLVKEKNNICFITGDHQGLVGNEYIISFLNSLFHPTRVSHKQLSTSHRCPSQVVALANGILQLKYHVSGGFKDLDGNDLRYIKAKDQENKGAIYWLREEDLTLLTQDKDNAHFAVVTSPEHQDEAKQLFAAYQVFTPEEIKGLEYRHVLIYRLLEQEAFQKASKLINKNIVLGQTDDFSPHGTTEYNPTFNALFVALTRAQVSISIYQPEKKEINLTPLTNPLKHFIAASQNKEQPHVQQTPTQSSASDWEKRKNLLKQQGLQKQAEAIDKRFTHLKPKTLSAPSAAPKDSTLLKKTTKKKKVKKNSIQKKEIVLNQQEQYKLNAQLFRAANLGQVDLVRQHIKEGAYVDVHLTVGNNDRTYQLTPLLIAAQFGHLEVIKTLLNYHVNVNEIIGEEQQTALHIAAYAGKSEVVELLLKHNANINQRNRDGETPLYIATERGHLNVVNVFLENGADVNKARVDGATPLIAALVLSMDPKVIYALLNNGADVNKSMNHELTPLCIAVEKGNPEVVRLLLLKGASLRNKGRALLCRAAELGHLDVVKIFLAAGADVHETISAGATPLYFAALVNKTEIIKTLLGSGANINRLIGEEKETPLHIAAYKGHREAVEILLQHKPYINQKNLNGETPLFLAARAGHTEVVNVLIESDAEIMQARNDGLTPLDIALRGGLVEVVQCICMHLNVKEKKASAAPKNRDTSNPQKTERLNDNPHGTFFNQGRAIDSKAKESTSSMTFKLN